MMHYKPLFGNPMPMLGNTDESANMSVEIPVIFGNDANAWELLTAIADLYFDGFPLNVLDTAEFDALDQLLQQEIHAYAVAIVDSGIDPEDERTEDVENLVNAIARAEGINSPIELEESEGEDIVGPPVPEGRESAVDAVVSALATVYPMQDLANHDIFFVLLNAVEQTQDHLGVSLSDAQIVEALEYFNNIAFPNYPLEELASCVFLVGAGETAILDAEESSMVSDDSREDALCSDRNRSIVLAAFGADASTKFSNFCNAAPESRMGEWTDVAGRNLATLLGISAPVFESFVLDAFDNGTADDLAAKGSTALANLIGDTIKNTERDPKAAIRGPQGVTKSASDDSGNHLLVAGAVFAGAAVGLHMLYKKIRNS
jgi:hypothetical protein